MTALSFFPDLSAIFLYIWQAVFIPAAGGFIILAAFFKLQEYNIYFKIMKYISIIYILALIGFTPFLIIGRGEDFNFMFDYISKIIRIFILFAFHYFMLSGIYSLAKSINNEGILKSAKFNIYFTYIYFGLSILGIIDFGGDTIKLYYISAVLLLGVVYFLRNFICIYRCYTQITYQGHDEELERKYEEKERRKKNKNIK